MCMADESMVGLSYSHSHDMDTLFTLIGPLWGESTSYQWFPSQTGGAFDAFFPVGLNILLTNSQVVCDLSHREAHVLSL